MDTKRTNNRIIFKYIHGIPFWEGNIEQCIDFCSVYIYYISVITSYSIHYTKLYEFIDEYPSIKAALWVGTPGSRGANSLGKILTGEVNPSGRLVDTYAYNIESHPSIVNFGDYSYNNIAGMSLLEYEEVV